MSRINPLKTFWLYLPVIFLLSCSKEKVDITPFIGEWVGYYSSNLISDVEFYIDIHETPESGVTGSYMAFDTTWGFTHFTPTEKSVEITIEQQYYDNYYKVSGTFNGIARIENDQLIIEFTGDDPRGSHINGLCSLHRQTGNIDDYVRFYDNLNGPIIFFVQETGEFQITDVHDIDMPPSGYQWEGYYYFPDTDNTYYMRIGVPFSPYSQNRYYFYCCMLVTESEIIGTHGTISN